MKVSSAKGKEALLIYCADGNYRIRVYTDNNEFIDYDIKHSDLWFHILDEDAYFYEDGDKKWLDHSPSTLGIDSE